MHVDRLATFVLKRAPEFIGGGTTGCELERAFDGIHRFPQTPGNCSIMNVTTATFSNLDWSAIAVVGPALAPAIGRQKT